MLKCLWEVSKEMDKFLFAWGEQDERETQIHQHEPRQGWWDDGMNKRTWTRHTTALLKKNAIYYNLSHSILEDTEVGSEFPQMNFADIEEVYISS